MDKDKEFWNIDLNHEDAKEIDPELIAELNDQYPEAEHKITKRKNKSTKIVALVTITIFCSLLITNWLQIITFPSLSFLIKSAEFSVDPVIRSYKEAVVKIDAGKSMGTGFNIAPDGLIVTNYHVVEDAKTLHVIFSSKTSFIGTPVLELPELDLAFLKVEGKDLPILEPALKSDLESGEEVLIIGNALGFFKVANRGEVLGRTYIRGIEEQVLMIKGPIYKGSSGSPVINEEGKVVAVIFATLVQDNPGNELIGLAIPIQYIAGEMEKIR